MKQVSTVELSCPAGYYRTGRDLAGDGECRRGAFAGWLRAHDERGGKNHRGALLAGLCCRDTAQDGLLPVRECARLPGFVERAHAAGEGPRSLAWQEPARS